MSEVTRLSVNLNQQTAAELKYLASHRGISYTEVIRQAIAVYNFVIYEQQQGNIIRICDSKGMPERDLVIL